MAMRSGKHYLVTEVCRKVGVVPHILRYWEKEFAIKPARNSAGRRIYTEAQVERLQVIKHLIRAERLTVAGARLQLARVPPQSSPAAVAGDHRQTLLWLRRELMAIRSLLQGNPNE
jgi:DNA-binding transcriptional MerR regulator